MIIKMALILMQNNNCTFIRTSKRINIGILPAHSNNRRTEANETKLWSDFKLAYRLS